MRGVMMRPERPTDNDYLPLFSTSWFTMKNYRITERNGIQYLVAEGGTEPKHYQPFEANPPQKKERHGQPLYPEDWNCLPHVNLARLDVNKTEDVIEFANRWGLLGLWKVNDFKGWSLPGDKPTGKPYSVHYINPDYLEGPYLYYQEPLVVFMLAVKKFQDMETFLEGNADDKSKAQDLINRFIKDCHPTTWFIAKPREQWVSHWETPSLLHTCYLLRWMDLISIKEYKRCRHKTCRKVFPISRPNEMYCSTRCKENAKVNRHYHRMKKEGK